MSTKEYELILGVLLLILSVILGYLEINQWLKLDKKDYMRKSNKVNILTITAILFIAGIVGIYRYFN